MKKLITALLVSLLAIHVYAEEEVQKKSDSNIVGHAVDAATGEHIPFITITLKGTTIGATSDATGHFFLKNLPSGDFTAVASSVGYESDEQPVTLVQGKTHEVNFTLKPSVVSINQVVVSANRNAINRQEAPTIVNVISDEVFENTASNTLADALNFQSGLRVEFNCGNCGVPQLRINGLEGQYSQILLDSRPMFSSLANVYGLEQMPVGMVERVEVIRGGGSALFGANAIGGVVNIITKEPVRNTLSLSNNTQVMDGGKTDVNTSINASFVSDDYRAGVYVFGTVRDREEYDRNGDGFSEIPRLNSETIGFRGYYKTGNYTKLTAEYHHMREFRRGGNNLDMEPFKADIAEQLRHGINGGGLKFDIFSKNYLHKINVYTSFQNIDRGSYFGGGGNMEAFGKTDDDTFLAGAQYSYSIRKLLFSPSELTVGYEYSDTFLHDRMQGYGRDIKEHNNVHGGYIQNEWKSRKINFIVGARLDKHSMVEDAVFSPRANVRYSPTEKVILRAGYSSGYRAPQTYDEDLHVGAVGEGKVTMIESADGLKPEYSDSFTGSVDLYATWGRVHANLLVEGFYTKLKDAFALVPVGEELIDPSDPDSPGIIHMERVNSSGAKISGVNIEGKLALSDKNYLQIGYTVQSSRYDEPSQWSDNPAKPLERRMLRAPDHYGYIALSCAPFRNAQATLNGTYTGEMLVPHIRPDNNFDELVKTRDFWDMGIKLSYDIRLNGTATIQLNCGVKNIFDQFQNDLDVGADKDAGFIYGPALPRTFFFGVKFTL